ncbi:hypothetical protein [Endozoicomonas ascidiicola]|uniref:hypothetical protein n=1 Tax=Endozoicomonas ascidiicola TaxID=1698521 RepID=UPI0012FA87ED|nr:hypothetical protein [Endozoicomonas ascidiicola]
MSFGLVTLASSVAALQLGMSRDVTVNSGQFSIEYPDSSIKVSKIHLDNLRTFDGSTQSDKDELNIQADALKFSLEIGGRSGEKAVLDIKIPDLKLSGETNLLFLIGNSVADYCKNLPGLLSSGGVNTWDDNVDIHDSESKKNTSDWATVIKNENTSFDVDAKSMVVRINKASDMFSGSGLTDGSEIAFTDFHVTQTKNLFKSDVENPSIKFGLVEVDNIGVGPAQIKDGSLSLDDNLNGKLSFTLHADYGAMAEYCPEWVPKLVNRAISGNDKKYAMVRLDAEISNGVIDLNSLSALGLGLSKKGLNPLQAMIQGRLVGTLNSEHTRLRRRDEGVEMKINVPLIGKQSTNNRGNLRNQSRNEQETSAAPTLLAKLIKKSKQAKQIVERNVSPTVYKQYLQISDESSVLIPESPGRGKISLVALLESLDVTLDGGAPTSRS